ncbi:hypothetical protein SM11_pC1087 (plasmid) [Sinorhizobium meliloti SM11]|uniref:Uncharacterized protein n=1 Tax=Sinorhizobium meliloti (strain SM11) TaxID=707241 RepID=F7XF35_SINMM|nr:hypothetical protein SM11_pC1087 [Sinorhizobium meliloti SM11]
MQAPTCLLRSIHADAGTRRQCRKNNQHYFIAPPEKLPYMNAGQSRDLEALA